MERGLIRVWLPMGSLGKVDSNLVTLAKPVRFNGALPDAKDFAPGHLIEWLPATGSQVAVVNTQVLLMVCVELPTSP